MSKQSIQPVHCRVIVLRAPVKDVVRTSFGTMRDRPAALVAITDASGHTGYGEIWCNFPSCGAEHRAQLLHTEIAPLLIGHTIQHPREFFTDITQKLHLLVKQTGEEGPVAQAIAAVDIALWDICAQLNDIPLYQLLQNELTGTSVPAEDVPINLYASGINPDQPQQIVEQKWQQGYRAFKLKVGFEPQIDIENAATIRSIIGPDAKLMVDANQGWTLDKAMEMLKALTPYNPAWVEEPLAVDAPPDHWSTLAKSTTLPLAGGENLRGHSEFQNTIDSGLFRIMQPDVAKWGGISGCLSVAQSAIKSGLIYCPHWLGAGVGLMASAHLLAAVGGGGMLEVDANPNPLRDELLTAHTDQSISTLQRWQPTDKPGLGIDLNEDTLHKYHVAEWSAP